MSIVEGNKIASLARSLPFSQRKLGRNTAACKRASSSSTSLREKEPRETDDEDDEASQ